MTPARRPRRRFVGAPVLAVLLALGTPLAAHGEEPEGTGVGAPSIEIPCAVEGPQSVVTCYQEAFANRDIGALAALLAPDFVSVHLDYPQAGPTGREALLRSVARFFDAPQGRIWEIQLALESDYGVDEGEQPGTWWLTGIKSRLRVTGILDDGVAGTYRLDHGHNWLVQLVPEPRPHFVIVREELTELEER
jgi:hypothetical protein